MSLEKGYPYFDEWAEDIVEREMRTQEKLAQKIAQEQSGSIEALQPGEDGTMGRLRDCLPCDKKGVSTKDLKGAYP